MRLAPLWGAQLQPAEVAQAEVNASPQVKSDPKALADRIAQLDKRKKAWRALYWR